MRTTTAAAASETYSPPPTGQSSPWQPPVPYLFVGLLATLGLIAFALLLLACSYRKHHGGAADEKDGGRSDAEAPPVLVIMAGDAKPTFLATPASGRASSPDDGKIKEIENSENKNHEEEFREYSTQLMHQERIHST
ncbi:hypothetical protein ACS0TY_022878 [Phlomoides rotata]